MANDLNALLGKGSEFQGKLTFEGSVRIDGRFTGEIFTDGTLIIGEGAQVQAEIRVGSIAIYGNVTGNVTANDGVELHAPASLRGNIASPALHIDKGVFFDGACQMTTPKDDHAPNHVTPAPARPVARPQTALQGRSSEMGSAAPMAAAISQSQPVPNINSSPVRQSGVFTQEPPRASGDLPHKF